MASREELKLECLKLAEGYREPAEKVVERARAYFEFVAPPMVQTADSVLGAFEGVASKRQSGGLLSRNARRMGEGHFSSREQRIDALERQGLALQREAQRLRQQGSLDTDQALVEPRDAAVLG